MKIFLILRFFRWHVMNYYQFLLLIFLFSLMQISLDGFGLIFNDQGNCSKRSIRYHQNIEMLRTRHQIF